MTFQKVNLRIALLGIFLAACCVVLKAQGTLSDIQVAAEYFGQGEYDKAREIYERLYRKNPSYAVYQNILQCHLRNENHKEGEKWIKSVRKKHKNDFRYTIDLGTLYMHQGNVKRMQEEFGEVLENLPANAHLIEEAANTFARNQQFDYVIKTYERGRELMKDPTAFTFRLVPFYNQQKTYHRIVADFFAILKKNPQLQNQIQAHLSSLLQTDQEDQLKKILKEELFRNVQQHPGNDSYANLLLWYLLHQKDYNAALIQIKAIDKRKPQSAGKELLHFAQTCLNDKAFDVAIQAFELVIAKGKSAPAYKQGRIGLFQSQCQQAETRTSLSTKELQLLHSAYETAMAELGKNAATAPLMQDYAKVLAFHTGNLQAAVDILNEILDIPHTAPNLIAECKLDMGDILLMAGDVWEASLLYSQVEKAFKQDVIGSEAKFRNAKLSYYIGVFEWAESQLNVLRASTSKLIANDAMELSLLINENRDDDSSFNGLKRFARADLALYQNKLSLAENILDSIAMYSLSHPLNDEILMRKAQIRIKQERYAEADSLLQKLLSSYPEDLLADDALYTLAELYEHTLKRPEKAMGFYKRLLLDYSNSLYVTEARKRYREIEQQQENNNP